MIYPVPIITNPNDFRANLGNMPAGRHAASLVAGFWGAVNHLIDGLLDVFYPEWSCPGFVDGARLSDYATTGCRCS